MIAWLAPAACLLFGMVLGYTMAVVALWAHNRRRR